MQYIEDTREQPVGESDSYNKEGDLKMKIYSSSSKKYDDYENLPIIKAIKKITKGGVYETTENEQKSFKQSFQKNSQ